jgi:hypothetical protein
VRKELFSGQGVFDESDAGIKIGRSGQAVKDNARKEYEQANEVISDECVEQRH